jgi:tetratricopeptide (TPR) repeat protein
LKNGNGIQHETVVFAGVCCLLVILSFICVVSVNAYNSRVRELSARWAEEGSRQLLQGRSEAAIEDFRNALIYDGRNPEYQLHLAQALMRVGRLNEAQAYLLHLWHDQPGSGTINLELARLFTKQNAIDPALRYFHNAIYGVWEGDPDESRRQVRLELIKFLLDKNHSTQADAELISLLPAMPKTEDAYVEAGSMFLQAGDYPRALEQFRHALRLDHSRPEALRGAGTAAFNLSDLKQSERYLTEAAQKQPADQEIKSMLDTVATARRLDPFEFRLSQQDRAARVNSDFQAAMQRLSSCTSQKPEAVTEIKSKLDEGIAIQQNLASPAYLSTPEAIESTMAFVFDAEALATRLCGAPQGVDLALQWIAKTREQR